MKIENIAILKEKLEVVEKLQLEIAVGKAAEEQLEIMKKSIYEKYGLRIEGE